MCDHIFMPNGGYYVYNPSNIFRTHEGFEIKIGLYCKIARFSSIKVLSNVTLYVWFFKEFPEKLSACTYLYPGRPDDHVFRKSKTFRTTPKILGSASKKVRLSSALINFGIYKCFRRLMGTVFRKLRQTLPFPKYVWLEERKHREPFLFSSTTPVSV